MTVSRARVALRELWAHWIGAPWTGAPWTSSLWTDAGPASDSGHSDPTPSLVGWSRAVLDPVRAYRSALRLEVESDPEPASHARLRIAVPTAAEPVKEAPVSDEPHRSRHSARGPDGRFIRRSVRSQVPPDPVPATPVPGPVWAPASAIRASSVPAMIPADPPQVVAATVTGHAVEALPATALGVPGETLAPVIAAGLPEMEPARLDTALRDAPPAAIDVDLSANRPIRIVLVEDVPEVAAHVREVLRPHGRFKLVNTIRVGDHAVEQIRDLDPDVVLVDSLLQGKTTARQIVDRLRANGRPIGIVAMTVPDYPAESAMLDQADAVVPLPFGTFDLGRAVMAAHAALTARDPGSTSRVVSVFSAKGGVGKTTIAYNLAVSLATTGLRTVLLDGSLQFGDVRRLLRADSTLPSICDLPTDSIRGSDLAETVIQVAPGVDALLAPPRPELAELISGRDLGRVLDVLRRAYQAIVIDTPANLSEPTLALLDASDVIIDVLTAESGALEATCMIAATFPEIGYSPDKIRYLVNRADSDGAAPMNEVVRAIGRAPDYTLSSDWPLVSSSNRDGVPYVLAQPEAPVSLGLRRVAHDVRSLAVDPPMPAPAQHRARIA